VPEPRRPVAGHTGRGGHADEPALLRWNARIDQVTGLRDAIDVERRRRDHEQLRWQVLVDELTGLANRRGSTPICRRSRPRSWASTPS
jgi:hypothetical protein